MNKPLFITIILFLLLTASLYATEEMTELMKHWLAVESALDNWQNTNEISPNNSTAQKLFASLEEFNENLETFTASLIYIQYEGTGLLPQDSGKTTRLMAKELTASVKEIALMESPTESSAELSAVSTLTAKMALTKKADTIRQELYSWASIDAQISSNVFSRSIYIFGVFSVFVIGMIVFTLLLYRALRHSQIQEQDSSDFSRITMLTQEKERALISAELHDTVLQDMGRLLQINKDASPKDRTSSELTQTTKQALKTVRNWKDCK